MLDQLDALNRVASNLRINNQNNHHYHYLINSIRNAEGTVDLISKTELFKTHILQNLCSNDTFKHSFFGNSTHYQDYQKDIDIYSKSLAHSYRLAAIDAIEENSYSTIKEEMGRKEIHNHVTDQLRSEGIAIVKDFLPKYMNKRLLNEAKTLMDGPHDSKDNRSKTNRAFSRGETLNKANSLLNQSLKELHSLVYHSPTISHIFKFAGIPNYQFYDAYTKVLESVFYQTLESKNSFSNDPQSDLHTDSYYHTLKFWITLTDVTEKTYHTEFCRKSHILSSERLLYESELSSKIFRNFDSIENQGTKNFAFRLHENEMKKSGFNVTEPEKLIAPAGSLIILNTRCFHCRSKSGFLPRYAIHFDLRPKRPLIPLYKFSHKVVKKVL